VPLSSRCASGSERSGSATALPAHAASAQANRGGRPPKDAVPHPPLSRGSERRPRLDDRRSDRTPPTRARRAPGLLAVGAPVLGQAGVSPGASKSPRFVAHRRGPRLASGRAISAPISGAVSSGIAARGRRAVSRGSRAHWGAGRQELNARPTTKAGDRYLDARPGLGAAQRWVMGRRLCSMTHRARETGIGALDHQERRVRCTCCDEHGCRPRARGPPSSLPTTSPFQARDDRLDRPEAVVGRRVASGR